MEMEIKMGPIIKKKTTIKANLEKITHLLEFIENCSTTINMCKHIQEHMDIIDRNTWYFRKEIETLRRSKQILELKIVLKNTISEINYQLGLTAGLIDERIIEFTNSSVEINPERKRIKKKYVSLAYEIISSGPTYLYDLVSIGVERENWIEKVLEEQIMAKKIIYI